MLNSIICNILSFIYGILVYKFINNNVAFYILCICFLIFTIYLIVINKSKIKKLSQELQKSKNYNNNLQLLYDEVITFRHDFGNIIQSIGGYVDNNDIQGLKEYYNQIIDQHLREEIGKAFLNEAKRGNNAHAYKAEYDNIKIYNLYIDLFYRNRYSNCFYQPTPINIWNL